MVGRERSMLSPYWWRNFQLAGHWAFDARLMFCAAGSNNYDDDGPQVASEAATSCKRSSLSCRITKPSNVSQPNVGENFLPQGQQQSQSLPGLTYVCERLTKCGLSLSLSTAQQSFPFIYVISLDQ